MRWYIAVNDEHLDALVLRQLDARNSATSGATELDARKVDIGPLVAIFMPTLRNIGGYCGTDQR
jgi:hypothetical protein